MSAKIIKILLILSSICLIMELLVYANSYLCDEWNNMDPFDLREYKEQFEKLHNAVYSDIHINAVGLRILGINLMDFGPGWAVNKHRHTFYEFHYVTENYTYTTINGTEQKTDQGHFYLMPPGTHHSHREQSPHGHVGFSLRWEFLNCTGPESKSPDMGMELKKTVRILENADTYSVSDDGSVISAMLELLKKADRVSGIVQLQLAFIQVLLTISAFYRDEAAKPIYGGCAIYENRIVENAIRFIEENYSQNINVMDVAYSVHMSYSNLSRLIRIHTGQTLKRHLNNIRLLKAQKLLHCTGMTVAQIAREVGFDSEQYFCTAFRNAFHISPGAYRQTRAMLSE